MTVTVQIRNADDWPGLQLPWQSLLDAMDNHSPFMTWEWQDAWLRQFLNERDFRIMVCLDDQDVIAIVPLVISARYKNKVVVRTAQLLGSGLSDLLRLLIRNDREDALQALAGFLKSPGFVWDVLDLSDLDSEDPVANAFAAALRSAGITASLDESVRCPYLAVESDWETFYHAQVGKKTRTTNRQKLRKLGALGDMQFRWVRNPDQVAAALDKVRAMDERREYHGAERIRPFDAPKGRAFFLDFCRRFAAEGWLLLGLIELDEAVIAYRFGFRYRNRHFDFFPGFAPEHFRLSVGRLLMTETLQQCFADGVSEVNFLRGEEGWKAEWTETSRANAQLTAYHPDFGSRLRRGLQAIPLP